MKEIIYCKKCHDKKRTIAYEKAVEQIKENYEGFEVIDMCMSTCGLSKKQFFLQVDDELVMGQTLEELLKNK